MTPYIGTPQLCNFPEFPEVPRAFQFISSGFPYQDSDFLSWQTSILAKKLSV
jgi:hypothetical protein